MTSAAVGFQCPECVAEGRATVRAPRTVFGAELSQRPDVVTRVLIAINLVVYVLQILIPSLTPRFDNWPVAVADGQWWRLFTAGFMHLSIIHIAFNMVALWSLGRLLEGQLGRWRFLMLYLVSLLAGSTASYLLAVPIQASAGASGAIFGLFAAMFVVAHRMRWDLRPFIGLLIVNALIPVVNRNIDWHAHVGGAIAGGIIAAAYAYTPREYASTAGIVAAAVLVAVCVGLIVHQTQTIKQDPLYGQYVGSNTDFITGYELRPFP
jgi:membrane associated rhomboid family serine protease